MPTNFAVFDIFPPNFFICEIKYSFSNVSLASLSGTERVSVTEKFSSKDLDSDSLIILIIIELDLGWLAYAATPTQAALLLASTLAWLASPTKSYLL